MKFTLTFKKEFNMSQTVSKLALTAGIVLAMAFTFSCTSDIESAEDVLKKAESSSSDGSSSSIGGLSSVVSLSSTGGSSSAVQGVSSGGSSQNVSVFCDFGGGDCREFNKDACLAFGQVVESCPGIAASSSSLAPPSSGSPVPSSSSVVLSGTVFCEFSGTCSPISAEACALLGGIAVQSCPESSSSAPPSSSSVPPSSTSVVPSSSSAPPSSSSVEPSSSSETSPSGTSGTFEDSRDGQTYKWVKINTQTWMAENLNYNATNSKCYANNDDNCGKYGRLYNWTTAMNGAASSTANPSGVQGICPSGWHLPSQAEWNTLSSYVQSNSGCSNCDARLLRAANGWNKTNGTDQYGFSAMPGGYGTSGGSFSLVGDDSNWWCTTETSANVAYNWGLNSNDGDRSNLGQNAKSQLLSVRCLQN